MSKLRNRATVPQGMLAPSGYAGTPVNPVIQSTTRPAGSLLPPSPGYASVRVGRNRFQGKGPTGGFRRMEFAEDVGGTGAVLSVVPGDTDAIDASEWLPESADSLPEGSMIVADRELNPGTAEGLHEGYNTIPDMGDRHPGRPLSWMSWRHLNPATTLREEYRESPAISVLLALGIVYLVSVVEKEGRGAYRRNRSRGGPIAGAPAAASETAGSSGADVIDKIGAAADSAVNAIGSAADKAVSSIENAARSATSTVSGE